MRRVHVVPATRDEDGALTADVPEGVSWVGNTNGVQYLIITLDESMGPGLRNDRQIERAAQDINLPARDPIDLWRMRGQ